MQRATWVARSPWRWPLDIGASGARTSSPPPLASGRVASTARPTRPLPMSPLELVLFGAACYLFGLVSGAVVIPWLVDRGLFPVRRHER